MKHKHEIAKSEQGLVSIIVVMILMGILVLVATSFALLMRREQRQALDRQLSTQAFYAAESGVHDVAAKINTITNNITQCGDPQINGGNANKIDGPSGSVEYTCVLVNKNPDSVVYDPVGVDNSSIVRLESATAGPISRIDISWQDASDGGVGDQFVPATNNSHLLPQNGVNNADTNNLTAADGTGMLRATIMPVANVASITQAGLTASAKTYFLYPKIGAVNGFGSVNGAVDDAKFIDGSCDTGSKPYYCNAHITSINGTNNGVVYLRLKAVYRPVAVTVKIYDGTGTPTNIVNAQAVIDSTGRSADVLRRIQVRVPIRGSYLYPEFAIDSLDTICKRTTFTQPGVAPGVELPPSDSSTPNTTPGIYYNQARDSVVCDPAAR